MGMSEHVLATHPGSGIKTLADLAPRAPRRPGHAELRVVRQRHLGPPVGRDAQGRHRGLDLIHVPYKGQAPALADLLGGQVTRDVRQLAGVPRPRASGKLVALGMATARRSAYAPDMPTLAEQGLAARIELVERPAGAARHARRVVQRLNAEVKKALKAPAVVQAFKEGGIASLPGTPERFAGLHPASEIDKYAQVIRKAGITADN
jgi:tripartite-type tricarboxylate transporter receptor subunit TctC